MKILVYGTGKTGTTALTYAIKESFNKDDYKIVFEPKKLTNINYSESNVIVKYLQLQEWKHEVKCLKYFDKRIIILRHPFDTIISRFLYNPFNGMGFSNDYNTKKYTNLLKMKAERPDDISFQEIINLHRQITKNRLLNSVQKNYKEILEIIQQKEFDLYKLKYEDFVDGNLNDLGKYLGVDIKSEVKVDAKFERVARSKKHSDWKNWFTEDDIKEILPFFADFIQILRYDTNLDKTEKVIEPATSYLYVINVINEYREKHGLPEYKDGVINIGEEGNYIDEAMNCLKKNDLQSAEEAMVKAFQLNPNLQAAYNLIKKGLKKKVDIPSKELENLDNKAIRISNIIRLHPNDSDLIWKFFLDSPIKNETNQFGLITIKGWIVGKKTPAEKIQLVQDSRVISETLVNIQRPGVVKIFPEVSFSWAEKSGFETQLVIDQNKIESEIVLRVVFEDKVSVDFARIEAAVVNLDAAISHCEQAILLNSNPMTKINFFDVMEQGNLISELENLKFEKDSILIFQHIGKTGGVSLSEMLRKNINPWYIIQWYRQKESWQECISRLDEKGYRMVGGHIIGREIEKFPFHEKRANLIAFIRNPIDRMISHYYHEIKPDIVTREKFIAKFPTIEAYIEAQPENLIINRWLLAEKLKNYEDVIDNIKKRYAFIGLTEYSNYSTWILAKMLGISYQPLNQINVNVKAKIDKQKISQDDRIVKMIAEKSSLDIKFYNYILQLYQINLDGVLRTLGLTGQ